MEIDFLELMEFIQNKNIGNIYEKFISQIKMLESDPSREMEISIPEELIKEFLHFKEVLPLE